ncbi:U3 small nucleolar RNA-associated protein 4 [Aspergillus udagawae]|uniref:U3 small nucleolar RNA-associated protein n=1 Tax=Aspergillus udagawae TaxID=91492 RepID=A0A8H3S5N2_9EURO|nr:U3 small nucleolar RNA-associated protein [Aspergillus udagawae]GFF48313.1 U3 small nucleolar RNA-associated protein 4 [Aspergillus udagawae]GFF76750.1 U3 small nucleolar RNA-associated protein 4 [Aspergillus udagawae]GIC84686.1 U3 small nucleolar RNA-associated protein [Aspergillus udagawae]
MDIHRCRFVPYNPQAINALSFSHPPSAELAGRGVPTLRLAIGRANGDIEIWNPMRGAWFQETVLRGGKDRSIEGLAWTLDSPETGPDGTKIPGKLRLFSIGYSTAVTEWDLEQGRPMRHSSGNYGEIWCIAAQPRWQATKRGKDGKPLPPAEGEYTGQHLAAGCADGSIVILSTADGDLKFLRLMRPSTKRARVLSVTFQNRHTIVAGYADSSIRLFDIRSGQLLRTISLGKGPAGGPKELLVWSVKCLPDGTIVSGDSAGEIRFWDAKNHSLIQRIQGHLADTLDVAVSANGDTVVSGGADQRTVVYKKSPGEKGEKKGRWAEVMHRRYHTHDVKTFAVYETRDISIVVSGGPDASPVVLPLREFGKEHHRKLSSLPQIPQLASSPSSRLVMSFWDREVSIWRVSRGPTSPHDNLEGQKHRLVGKVLIQGEENITSAMLSVDGKILIVATVTEVKVFSVRRRKSDERGALRITKLDVPAAFTEDGARVVAISPDSRWLCVVRPNSAIYLARVMPASSPQEKPQILSQLVKLYRATRHTRHEKASHGTLGEYERTVRCVVFSENSRILATGDLSGCVDTWFLKNGEDSSSEPADKRNGAADSDDESSDDEDERPVIDGERWQYANADSPIPRLKSGVLLLSFRPQSPAEAKLLTNGTDQSSQKSLRGESRLMALTSEHQLVEFDALEGKLSDWSRRNPKAYLPEQFKGVKDRAMGCLWDLSESRDRLWLYGTSWLWMFDLNQDFPSPEELKETADGHDEGDSSTQLVKASSAHKRKREQLEEEEKRRKANSGAGDRMSLAQSDVHFSSKYRKIEGHDDSKGEWVSLDKERPQAARDEEAFEYDENSTAGHDAALARLRRGKLEEDEISTPRKRVSLGPRDKLLSLNGSSDTPARKPNDNDVLDTPQKQLVQSNGSQLARRWWYTYKYRDLLGIVPLSPSSTEDSIEDGTAGNTLEVAVVERPMWDVELPGRYVRDYA